MSFMMSKSVARWSLARVMAADWIVEPVTGDVCGWKFRVVDTRTRKVGALASTREVAERCASDLQKHGEIKHNLHKI
jgi:hypothetical protein